MRKDIIYEDINIYNSIKKREERIKKLKSNNNYDQKIVDFYNDGCLVINGKKEFFNKINVVDYEKNNELNNMIDFVDSDVPFDKDIKIKKITKLRDTSIFKDIVDKYYDQIKDNSLEVDSDLEKYLKEVKWDGKYHDLVAEAHEIKNRLE